jgi:hypothetical protein
MEVDWKVVACPPGFAGGNWNYDTSQPGQQSPAPAPAPSPEPESQDEAQAQAEIQSEAAAPVAELQAASEEPATAAAPESPVQVSAPTVAQKQVHPEVEPITLDEYKPDPSQSSSIAAIPFPSPQVSPATANLGYVPLPPSTTVTTKQEAEDIGDCQDVTGTSGAPKPSTTPTPTPFTPMYNPTTPKNSTGSNTTLAAANVGFGSGAVGSGWEGKFLSGVLGAGIMLAVA